MSYRKRHVNQIRAGDRERKLSKTFVDRPPFVRVPQDVLFIPAGHDGARRILPERERKRAADQSCAKNRDTSEGGDHGLCDGPADGWSNDTQFGHQFFKLLEEERLGAIG